MMDYKKFQKKNNGVFLLQLTSMVDMFTIILVFLLKSYSTSAIQVTPADGIDLPVSASVQNPVEGLKIAVSEKGITVDDVMVVPFSDKAIPKKALDPKDSQFIPSLFKDLEVHAKKSQKIASVNEDIQFKGLVVMQAHKSIDYRTLKKVMYTATLAGYADFRLATIANE